MYCTIYNYTQKYESTWSSSNQELIKLMGKRACTVCSQHFTIKSSFPISVIAVSIYVYIVFPLLISCYMCILGTLSSIQCRTRYLRCMESNFSISSFGSFCLIQCMHIFPIYWVYDLTTQKSFIFALDLVWSVLNFTHVSSCQLTACVFVFVWWCLLAVWLSLDNFTKWLL